MKPNTLLFLFLTGICIPALIAWQSPIHSKSAPSSTIILDATEFLDEIPSGHRLVDADELGLPWLFNNTGLLMTTRSTYLKKVEISESGKYYLYARTHGRPGSTLRVTIGEQVIDSNLADDSLRFEMAGSFNLDAGIVDIKLMRVENNPVLDVLVLSKDPGLSLEELRDLQLNEEVVLLKEYELPPTSCVKFGDVTGDGETDLLVFRRDYSAQMFDFEGKALWSYDAPEAGEEKRRSFEAPGLLWDMDQDGLGEVVHWRQDAEGEWLCMANGKTGEIIHRTPWPSVHGTHEYNNFRLAVGRLKPGYPEHILAFTDVGGEISITAYDKQLKEVWQHVETKKKDHLGHYVYPVDLDGDGLDEVVVSALVLDAEGKEIRNSFDFFFDNHDHADSYRFADLDDDGTIEMVSANSETGVFAYEAISGELKWQNVAEHTQQLEIGDFLAGRPGPQIAVGARTYGERRFGIPYLWAQVRWISPDGEVLSRWPANPLNGNPVFVKGDWRGDGQDVLFWFKFRMLEDGRGSLYFSDPVYHMFDFIGGAAEEVVTLDNGFLKVYGFSGAADQTGKRDKTPEYLKTRVANHTHY